MKAYTDIEQSKKLAEILPLESADMIYIWHATSDNPAFRFDGDMPPMVLKDVPIKDITTNTLPCWSLVALLDVLPKGVKSPFGEINPFVGQVGIKDYRCVYLDGDWDSNIQTFANNPIDACYEMIIKLKEQELL